MHPRTAPEATERRRRRGAAAVVAVAGVLAASTMVWKASTAAFTATTTNGTNTFSTGTVTLTDSDAGAAMFTVPPYLSPGATGSACLRVTYNGTLAADVRLHTTGLTASNGLDAEITMVVEAGTTSPANAAGVFSCANFTPSGAVVANDTLNGLGTTNTSYASGLGTWAPTGSGQTRDFRFTYTFSSSAPDSVQNSSASIGFVWEAHST